MTLGDNRLAVEWLAVYRVRVNMQLWRTRLGLYNLQIIISGYQRNKTQLSRTLFQICRPIIAINSFISSTCKTTLANPWPKTFNGLEKVRLSYFIALFPKVDVI